MLAVVSTPRQPVRQVRERIKCDSCSTVARATHLIAGASGVAPDGGICFPGKFSIMASAFALDQVLNFGSLAYVTDCLHQIYK